MADGDVGAAAPSVVPNSNQANQRNGNAHRTDNSTKTGGQQAERSIESQVSGEAKLEQRLKTDVFSGQSQMTVGGDQRASNGAQIGTGNTIYGGNHYGNAQGSISGGVSFGDGATSITTGNNTNSPISTGAKNFNNRGGGDVFTTNTDSKYISPFDNFVA